MPGCRTCAEVDRQQQMLLGVGGEDSIVIGVSSHWPPCDQHGLNFCSAAGPMLYELRSAHRRYK